MKKTIGVAITILLGAFGLAQEATGFAAWPPSFNATDIINYNEGDISSKIIFSHTNSDGDLVGRIISTNPFEAGAIVYLAYDKNSDQGYLTRFDSKGTHSCGFRKGPTSIYWSGNIWHLENGKDDYVDAGPCELSTQIADVSVAKIAFPWKLVGKELWRLQVGNSSFLVYFRPSDKDPTLHVQTTPEQLDGNDWGTSWNYDDAEGQLSVDLEVNGGLIRRCVFESPKSIMDSAVYPSLGSGNLLQSTHLYKPNADFLEEVEGVGCIATLVSY